MAFADFPFLDIPPSFDTPPQSGDTILQARIPLGYSKSVVKFPQRRFGTFLFEFAFMTRAEQRAFLSFWNLRAGRHECFWLPSWQSDFSVVSGIEEDSDEIEIIDTEFSTVWNPESEDDPGYYLFFRSRVHGIEVRRVINKTATTIQFSLPFYWTDPKAQVGMIFLSRFDQDELTMKAVAPGCSRVQVAFKQVSFPNS